jgi:hypothetical protein
MCVALGVTCPSCDADWRTCPSCKSFGTGVAATLSQDTIVQTWRCDQGHTWQTPLPFEAVVGGPLETSGGGPDA